MKKIIIFLACILCAVGCSCSRNTASNTVEKYLDSYKNLSDNVLKDIDDLTKKENLSDKHGEIYKEVLKRQYRDLNYTIENEKYDGDSALVTVKITVYDLYKVNKNSNTYLNSHQDEFLTDGAYDNIKYLEYKLKEMKDVKDTISYTIVLKTEKKDGKWELVQPDEETLEKLHGIYNYEENDDK